MTAGGGELRVLVPDLDGRALPAAPGPGEHPFALRGETMGTVWRLTGYRPARLDESHLQDSLLAVFAQMIATFSQWDTASELSRFNALGPGRWTSVSADFLTVLLAARTLAVDSDGAFNPLLGTETAAFAFDPLPGPGVPGGARGDGRELQIDAAAARARRPLQGVLDLSAIAKGFALDRAAGVLGALGLSSFLIEIGGEFIARGIRHDLTPWWVDLTPDGGQAVARLALVDQALAGSARARDECPGGIHILDARGSGDDTDAWPACWVIADTCMMADGWATALCATSTAKAIHLTGIFGLCALALRQDGSALPSRPLEARFPDA